LAILPIVAAIVGMVVPVLIYISFNPEGDALNGWGVPMATDIAFALGTLALLGSREPKGLNFKHIVGAGLMGGIGFTMSIFVAELGFAHNPEELLPVFQVFYGSILRLRSQTMSLTNHLNLSHIQRIL
jgi:Na+/H+ antiporter NhaA